MMKRKNVGVGSGDESAAPRLARRTDKPLGSAVRVGSPGAVSCAAGAEPGDTIVLMVRDPDGSMRALGPDDAGFDELFEQVNVRMGGGLEYYGGEDLVGAQVKAVLKGRADGEIEAVKDEAESGMVVSEMEKALGLAGGAISQKKRRLR